MSLLVAQTPKRTSLLNLSWRLQCPTKTKCHNRETLKQRSAFKVHFDWFDVNFHTPFPLNLPPYSWAKLYCHRTDHSLKDPFPVITRFGHNAQICRAVHLWETWRYLSGQSQFEWGMRLAVCNEHKRRGHKWPYVWWGFMLSVFCWCWRCNAWTNLQNLS